MEHKQELGHKEPSDIGVPEIKITTNDEHDVSFFHDFIAGGVAGSASVVVGHPLDTVKVRMQTARGNPSLLHLTLGKKYGGPGTLFSGMIAPLSTACIVNAIIFSSYGWSTRLFEERYIDQNNALKGLICGSFAGLVQALVICPMEHVKCRLQTQGATAACVASATATSNAISSKNVKLTTSYHPLRSTLSTILKSGGSSFNVAALYRGWWITCWREVPAFGAYFTLYDIFKDHIQDALEKYEAKAGECFVDGTSIPITTTDPTSATTTATIVSFDEAITNQKVIQVASMKTTVDTVDDGAHLHTSHTWISSAISGGLTGALTWAMVYPFDVIKTQIQTAPIDTPRNEQKIAAVVRSVVKQHGWKHLFRGLTVTCLRAFPVNGIIFPVYEYTLLQVCAWEA